MSELDKKAKYCRQFAMVYMVLCIIMVIFFYINSRQILIGNIVATFLFAGCYIGCGKKELYGVVCGIVGSILLLLAMDIVDVLLGIFLLVNCVQFYLELDKLKSNTKTNTNPEQNNGENVIETENNKEYIEENVIESKDEEIYERNIEPDVEPDVEPIITEEDNDVIVDNQEKNDNINNGQSNEEPIKEPLTTKGKVQIVAMIFIIIALLAALGVVGVMIFNSMKG